MKSILSIASMAVISSVMFGSSSAYAQSAFGGVEENIYCYYCTCHETINDFSKFQGVLNPKQEKMSAKEAEAKCAELQTKTGYYSCTSHEGDWGKAPCRPYSRLEKGDKPSVK